MIELDQLLVLNVLFNLLEGWSFAILDSQHSLQNHLKLFAYVRVRELYEILILLEVFESLDKLIFGSGTQFFIDGLVLYKLIHHYSTTPYIYILCVELLLSEDFWRSIMWCAHVFSQRLISEGNLSTNSKVPNFYFILLVYEDVGRFEISMNNKLFVDEYHALHD